MNTKEYFSEVCERIKSQGFRVFVATNTEYHYGWFSDGKNIGYFQLEWNGYDGTSLTTVNAKGSGCSGYGVKGTGGGYALDELTRDVLEQAFATYPKWVGGLDVKKVVKYDSLEQFLEDYWNAKNLIEV